MEMDLMDASILIIRPKQAFIDWVNEQCKDIDFHHKVTLENYNDECGPHTYLVPDFEALSKAKSWLKKNYLIIFEEELSGWSLDENDWPEELTYQLFDQWFEIEFNLMVFDLRNI